MAEPLTAARYYGVSEGVAAATEESVESPLSLARYFGLSEWAVAGIQNMVNKAGVPPAPTVVILTGSSDGSGDLTASCTPPIGTILSYEWLMRGPGAQELTFVGATPNLGTVQVPFGMWICNVRAKNVSGWGYWSAPPSDQALVE